MRGALEMIGLVLFEPQAFGGGGFDARRLAAEFDESRRAAERARDLIGLALDRGVAGEFRGADDAVCLIQQHQPALRSGHADGGDPFLIDLRIGEQFAHRTIHGGDPVGRVLFAVAGGQSLDPIMRHPCLRADRGGFEIQNQRARAGMADFYADELHGS